MAARKGNYFLNSVIFDIPKSKIVRKGDKGGHILGLRIFILLKNVCDTVRTSFSCASVCPGTALKCSSHQKCLYVGG